MTDDPLTEMRAAAMRLRAMADRQAQLLELDSAFLDLSPRHAEFARFSIAMARSAAAALDAAIAVHRETRARIGDPRPAPRPRLRLLDGNGPPDAAA
jgi:hypothetical protein